MIPYWSKEDGAYLAEVPELAGCMADGATYQEALESVETVIQEWIETARELGRPIPEPRGTIDVRLSRDPRGDPFIRPCYSGSCRMPGEKFEQLVALMARLRGPQGCPWDREQTFDTIKSYLVEETYEVIDAIDRRDWPELAGELGDLQLQVVFFSQMAAEEGRFTIADVLDRINDKLVRRHPHVFGDETAQTAGAVVKRWNELKAEEKGPEAAEKPLLESVPRGIPALPEAYQLSVRASQVGFDWERFEDLLEKLREEMAELEAARQSGEQAQVENETGDLLFMLVNIARFLKVDPELALRKTNRKFRQRFAHVERGIGDRGKTLGEASIAEMEDLWQQAKKP